MYIISIKFFRALSFYLQNSMFHLHLQGKFICHRKRAEIIKCSSNINQNPNPISIGKVKYFITCYVLNGDSGFKLFDNM